MSPSAQDLGRAKVAQLLAAVGSRPAPDPAPPETTPYDWRDPHYFNADQQTHLRQALEQVAARLAEVMGRARRGVCTVSLKSATQHFAGDLCRRLGLEQNYCLTFAPEKEQACGFAAIPPHTARTWVTWLLGDSEAARDPNQALSPLEESLLADLATTVLDTFLAPLRTAGTLQAADTLGKGQPLIAFELTEEIVKVVFQARNADADDPMEITFVLPAGRLAALAGKPTPAASKATPQELSRALLEHVQELTVTVQATLASVPLTFQEILDLAPGDVLLLDKPIEEGTDLMIDSRALFCGRPAHTQGKYAVVITEAATGTPPAAAAKAAKPANERI